MGSLPARDDLGSLPRKGGQAAHGTLFLLPAALSACEQQRYFGLVHFFPFLGNNCGR
jgi:hypothetical protein